MTSPSPEQETSPFPVPPRTRPPRRHRFALRRIRVVASWLLLLAAVLAAFLLVDRRTGRNDAVRLYRVATEAEASPPDAGILRIAAYNVAHGRGGVRGASNWRHGSEAELRDHLRAVARQIRATGADLVILAETDFDAAWSHGVNQAELLARLAGYPWVAEQRNYDLGVPGFRFRFGNAILSRHPLGDAELVDLPSLSRLEDLFLGNHDALYAVARSPAGPLGVLALHLDFRREDVRVGAVGELLDFLARRRRPPPTVVAGDLNSAPRGHPGSETDDAGRNAVDLLVAEGGFRRHAREDALTFPSEAPEIQIDWTLAGEGVELVETAVVESDLSDHFMVTATLRLD